MIATAPRITHIQQAAIQAKPETDLRSLLDVAVLHLTRRFRFETHTFEAGLSIEADDLTLHVLENDTEFTVIFEPFDSPNEPIHIAARANEIEAVLRELLAT